MRKLGARILLCIMLIIALVTSTLTAFATSTVPDTATPEVSPTPETSIVPETSNPSSTTSDKVVPDGLDLSKFKDVDLKDVGGVYDGNLCIKDKYSYFLLYVDKDSFYVWKTKPSEEDGDTEDSEFVSIPVGEVNKYINDKNYYNTSFDYREGYSVVNSIESLSEDSKSKKVYILLADDKGYYNLGLFDRYEDLEKISKLDLSIKLPELKVEVKKEKSSANIVVRFSSNTGVSSIICRDSKGSIVENYSVPDKDFKVGACIFTVYDNDTYTIEGYNNYYISRDDGHSSVDVKISGLSKFEPAKATVTDLDIKAPKITFSKLPKSALLNSEVEITMYSNEPAILSFNGTTSDDYVTEMKVVVKSNGEYFYNASDKSSNSKDGKLSIDFFGKNQQSVDTLDRDGFWGNVQSTLSQRLPQTGSTGWYLLIAFGVGLIGVGGFVVFKSVKTKKSK